MSYIVFFCCAFSNELFVQLFNAASNIGFVAFNILRCFLSTKRFFYTLFRVRFVLLI